MNRTTDHFALAQSITRDVIQAGGSAFIVGGYVRDRLMGLDSKDIDLEIFRLPQDTVETILRQYDPDLEMVGKSFGVYKVCGLDVSLPRTERKVANGHTGFDVTIDPFMSMEDAARRRDFTCNTMFLDPLSEGAVFDFLEGRISMERKRLDIVNSAAFAEDPLRILRAAQHCARFLFTPDVVLVKYAKASIGQIRELPAERLYEEWVKLLVKGRKPSWGMALLSEIGAYPILFPEIAALQGVQQEPEYHGEGDVLTHTLMALDEAVALRTGDEAHDLTLMFAVLCHDFGKATTTEYIGGRTEATKTIKRWRSYGHDDAGVSLTLTFLQRLNAPIWLTKAVCALVQHHLAPCLFVEGTSDKSYRRLARMLDEAGTTMRMLYEVAQADHFGRISPDAQARRFPDGERFLQRAEALEVVERPEPDVVMGRHLIARGMTPGPEFGVILKRCREIQETTGLKDVEAILKEAWQMTVIDPDICYCCCKNLCCTTLFMCFADGGHVHYSHLPCPNRGIAEDAKETVHHDSPHSN